MPVLEIILVYIEIDLNLYFQEVYSFMLNTVSEWRIHPCYAIVSWRLGSSVRTQWSVTAAADQQVFQQSAEVEIQLVPAELVEFWLIYGKLKG